MQTQVPAVTALSVKKILLNENDLPGYWYNIIADMKNKPLPTLNQKTREPLKEEDLSSIFPKELIAQELSEERYIEIPEEVKEIYKIWRPTPLIRATGLEKYLKTDCKIYYKYEGVSPSGSHKPNSSVPQIYYNKKEGVKKIVTELAVLDVLPEGGFRLLERAPGVTVEEIKLATAGKLIIDGDIPEMVL